MPNNPLPDAELAELRRLHAAATPGEWQAQAYSNYARWSVWAPDGAGCIAERWYPTGTQDEIPRNDLWIVAVHNAYPALCQRLTEAESRLAEAEREIEFLRSAGEAEVNFWVNVIRSLDMENLCDFFDGEGAKEELQRWLAARDAQQRRDGAAEAWDIVAERSKLVGDAAGEKYATEAAQRLREGE